jgi:organic hydroperoxide reductase OsmC/OhrA
MKEHHYRIKMEWTGNQGQGTQSYRAYSRDHLISADGKPVSIPASSDPSFRGDPTRYNPEELFLASLSACHMLWFLHLCSVNKIVVTDYVDQATGIMEEAQNGSGKFREVTLHPRITVEKEEMIGPSLALHHEANQLCFIANSCNFPVKHEPETTI